MYLLLIQSILCYLFKSSFISLWLDASDVLSNFIILKKFLLLQSGMVALHRSSTAIILESPFIIFLGICFASHLCWIPCFLDPIFSPVLIYALIFNGTHPSKGVHRWQIYFEILLCLKICSSFLLNWQFVWKKNSTLEVITLKNFESVVIIYSDF